MEDERKLPNREAEMASQKALFEDYLKLRVRRNTMASLN